MPKNDQHTNEKLEEQEQAENALRSEELLEKILAELKTLNAMEQRGEQRNIAQSDTWADARKEDLHRNTSLREADLAVHAKIQEEDKVFRKASVDRHEAFVAKEAKQHAENREVRQENTEALHALFEDIHKCLWKHDHEISNLVGEKQLVQNSAEIQKAAAAYFEYQLKILPLLKQEYLEKEAPDYVMTSLEILLLNVQAWANGE